MDQDTRTDIFNDCIKEVRAWFQQKMDTGKARTFEAAASSSFDNSDDGAKGPNIIFREDMALELGHPSVGSCAAVLATRNASLIKSGRITLVGPDVGETEEQRLSFAQIALSHCEGSPEEACPAMDRVLHASALIEGYMLRSVPNMIWARVSKDAMRSGFSLRDLGSILISSLNSKCPGIIGSEVLFVTGRREDIDELNEIVGPARDKLRKIQTFGRNEDGSYECDTSLDCTVCPEKPVCDTIRDVIKIRKGDRIITIGGDENGDGA